MMSIDNNIQLFPFCALAAWVRSQHAQKRFFPKICSEIPFLRKIVDHLYSSSSDEEDEESWIASLETWLVLTNSNGSS